MRYGKHVELMIETLRKRVAHRHNVYSLNAAKADEILRQEGIDPSPIYDNSSEQWRVPRVVTVSRRFIGRNWLSDFRYRS